MGALWTRRGFVTVLPAFAAAADSVVPTELKKFRDPATEFELLRYTDPTANAWMPVAPSRTFSSRLGGLIYSSDRGGGVQAYRLDIKSGEGRQLTSAAALDPRSVSISPDDRSLCYFDGNALTVQGARTRVAYTVETGWVPGGSLALTDDSASACFTEEREGRKRLRVVSLQRGEAHTVFQTGDAILDVRPRPKKRSVLFRSGSALWSIDLDGRNHRKVRNAAGLAGPALWANDGKTFVYINFPEAKGRLFQLRECTPDSDEDKLIAGTSEFVQFARNADGSIFAGISGNKSSPYLLLLHRTTRRELTLAEHRASDPHKLVVTFSPNSQRLFYQTDREGKSAIYSIALERFVEKTDT